MSHVTTPTRTDTNSWGEKGWGCGGVHREMHLISNIQCEGCDFTEAENMFHNHLLCLPAKCIGCKRAGWKSLLMRYKCDTTETSRVRSYQYAIIHFMGSEVTDSWEILSIGVAYWGKCLSDPALVNVHLWQNAFLTNVTTFSTLHWQGDNAIWSRGFHWMCHERHPCQHHCL